MTATSETATRWHLGLAAIVLVIAALAGRSAPPIDVTAAEVEATYRAELMPRYRGEAVTVSGIVTRIGTRRAFVMLGSVECAFDGSVPALTVGDRVRLRGLGGGYILGSPMFEHCTLAR